MVVLFQYLCADSVARRNMAVCAQGFKRQGPHKVYKLLCILA
jgi:hypothetical protein